ncbi:hypothetical protein H2198_007815 [Neophaeococcomyces mojaviensis]|uniref:Uncharacterized protein n=1 Tax=Neophaeococcomyces mojaviensis TaxID=3383035 RepID=A0ACC2ZZ53_9EURO|nr:hypothetical protein H2198_007815 [Knufia sp. JES_112]
MRFFTLLSALTVLPAVMALPAPAKPVANSLHLREYVPSVALFSKRESCAATCGTVCYYQSTINTAVSNGYSLYKSGKEQGSSDYPHTYNNYEGFDFGVSGPYQEYPIMNNFKAYSGGSPGADRVIFNTQGNLAGVVTHTGASGNNFVSC